MPPVRWKHISILLISACIVQQIGATKSSNIPESYSIIGDGWTPIIGQQQQQHHRGDSPPPSIANNGGEITMYRNPASKTSEPIKAEKLHMSSSKQVALVKSSGNQQQQQSQRGEMLPRSTGQHQQQYYKEQNVKNSSSATGHQGTKSSNKPIMGHGISAGHNVNTITSGGSSLGGKIPPHSKPLLLLPASHASHGPHIPLNSLPMPNPPAHRPPPMNKHHQHPHQHYQHYPHGHHGHHPHQGLPPPPMGQPPMMGPPPNNRPLHHKPPPPPPPPPMSPPPGSQGNRQVVGAHSTRDEVFVQAPKQIGAFSFYQQNPSQIKTTRIAQPHGHIEFTNHYGGSDPNLYSLSRQPIQQYIIPKHPVVNDVHYVYQTEDFTRNLVPPPAYTNFGHEHQLLEKQKIAKPVTEAYIQEKKKQGQFVGSYANGNPPDKAVDVQVTKEHLKVYHNNYVPQGQEYEFGNYHTIKHPSDPPKLATYEVTEGKQWQETQPYYQPFSTRAPHKSRRPQHVQTSNHIDIKPFLPTPFKPEHLQPTIATQSEISTIYNQLSLRNKHRDIESNFNPINPSFFSVKEVSTHFPVVGQPAERPDFITQPPQVSYTTDPPTEVTTHQHRFKDFDFVPHVEEESTIPPTRQPNYNTRPPVTATTRKRPQQRRRRPGVRYKYQPSEEVDAVTESVEAQKVQESEGSEESTERNRLRRPTRYRTTESPLIEKEDEKMSVIRSRNRYRVSKPTTTEQAVVETTTRQEEEHEPEQERLVPKVPVTERDFPESFEEQFKSNVYNYQTTNPPEFHENNGIKSIVNISTEDFRTNIFYNPKPTDLSDVTIYENNKSNQEDAVVPNTATDPSYEIRKPFVEEYDLHLYEKKESIPHNIMKVDDFQSASEKSTNVNVPENEIDYTTLLSNSVESATSMDIYKEEYHKVPTTTTPTESSTSAVTRPSRTRGRPGNRFDTNRPRFSVKDYRQRSTTTTVEPVKAANLETSTRIRFPNRSRRPLATSTTTQRQDFYDETTTERTRGTPERNYTKHVSNKEENESFAEKHYRGNTRRPFGRNRSTTDVTTTSKVSIKPHVFSNLRRPTPVSLRNRILNRQNKTTTASTTTEVFAEPEETNETDLSEIVGSTLPYVNTGGDSTTEFGAKKTVDIEVATTREDGADILKNESFMYSQRVSDLTSSSKNDYNTPGRFKNVPSSSRRVPNYFTLATDEPILPIQAFFPNIKDKA